MVAHATLGASNAHRWLVCAGSVEAERDIPNTSSPFAEEGTRAHDMAEAALRSGDPNAYLDAAEDREMAEFVRVYTDYVWQSAAGKEQLLIEQRVYYDDWVPNGFGTADAVIVDDGTLHVCDLKYGMGVRVDAEENPQAMLYALGAYSQHSVMYNIDTVTVSIVQPRLDHISEWSISVERLLRWAEWVTQRAEATAEPDAERVPGEKQCRFCRAKHNCAALKSYTENAILSDFDDLDGMPMANKLTDEQMRVALEAKPLIEAWLSAIEAHVKERLTGNEAFPGFKLVEGRSNRQWINENAAAHAMERLVGAEKTYTRKIVTPTQAEKLLGKSRKAEIEDLIVKPSGKPTLAPESDKRAAINISLDDFDVLDTLKIDE